MTKTITKSDLVNHLHENMGLNKVESKEIVEAFFEEIKNSLVNNEEISYLLYQTKNTFQLVKFQTCVRLNLIPLDFGKKNLIYYNHQPERAVGVFIKERIYY